MMGIFELDEVANIPDRENLLIVDTLNLSFRFKHRGITDFKAELLKTVQSLARSYGARDVIMLSDKGSSKYRKEIHPGYKSGRKEKYKDQTPEEEEQVRKFFEGFEEAWEFSAAQTDYEMLRFQGVEADDLAAYITKKLKVTGTYEHIWLVSTDGDWDLLLDENVSRFSFTTRKEYTIDTFFENQQCESPEDFISIKVLMGDLGDSIAGIPNVGVKRAYNYVREFGSAMGVYDSIPLPGKGKVIDTINSSGDLIIRNYELMDLLSFCEDAIGEENIKEIDRVLKSLV